MGVRESHLKGVGGWTSDSRMPGVYIHLSGIDVEETVLRANGVEMEPPKPTLRPMTCSRCGFVNEPTAIYCSKCGTGLREKPDETKVMLTESNLDAIVDRLVEKALGDKLNEFERLRGILKDRGLLDEIEPKES